jgi:hypothetical protein
MKEKNQKTRGWRELISVATKLEPHINDSEAVATTANLLSFPIWKEAIL